MNEQQEQELRSQLQERGMHGADIDEAIAKVKGAIEANVQSPPEQHVPMIPVEPSPDPRKPDSQPVAHQSSEAPDLRTDVQRAQATATVQPCEPCGQPAKPIPAYAKNKPPYWLLMAEALHKAECDQIIDIARQLGWEKGRIIDGKTERNSSVRFIYTDWVLERMRQLARHAGPLLGIDVTPELLDSVQIGRYLPNGEDYGWHVDHDPTRRHIEYDRKLSLVGCLSPASKLHISGCGAVNMNPGDILAFSGNVSHMAPPLDYKRFTIVAWIPGPNWR